MGEAKIQIPDASDARTLRIVELRGTQYVLHTWTTGKRYATGQEMIGYAFYHVSEDDPIFVGEDCGVSPMHAIDSDDALRGLLGFLTLRRGDTDPDYFANYTPRQIAFAESSDCEFLTMWAMEPDASEREEWAESYAFDDRDSDRW